MSLTARPAPPEGRAAVQISFDDLGTPLHDVTFTVADLETTGASPASARITEIAAVKVRGGVVLDEFQALVDPGVAIPPFISVLTGITDSMLRGAPRLSDTLPAFLDFLRGTVLVAHNAPFDVGFLQAACAATALAWPTPVVVDTARLARKLVDRDEAPDCRLATLARLFRSSTTPAHRALADARATVDVLHALVERLGSLGVESLDELATFSSRVPPAIRRKRHLADRMPPEPGVYLFTGPRREVLYIGRSRNLHTRVRSYFTASETRRRIGEMVRLAEDVVPIVCATPLEAEVRELRLIAEHKPRYNRQSRHPERAVWLKLTVEAFPRLSVVRAVRDDGAAYLGPFSSSRVAEHAMAAVHEAFPVRQCTRRLSPRRLSAACALAEMGRCAAPCSDGASPEQYAVHVAAVRSAMERDPRPLVDAVMRRIDTLSATQRFEEAAVHRDRLTAFVTAAARMQRLAALSSVPLLVAARPADGGGTELTVVRHGRLVGAATAPPGAAVADDHVPPLLATAETVRPGPGPLPAATAEESECILRWLEQPGTRLLEVDGVWCCPAPGAPSVRDRLRRAYEGRDDPDPLVFRTRHRPEG